MHNMTLRGGGHNLNRQRIKPLEVITSHGHDMAIGTVENT